MEECCEEDSVATRYCALNRSDVKASFTRWSSDAYLRSKLAGLWAINLLILVLPKLV